MALSSPLHFVQFLMKNSQFSTFPLGLDRGQVTPVLSTPVNLRNVSKMGKLWKIHENQSKKCPKIGPKWPEIGPKWPEMGSKMARNGPEMGPKWSKKWSKCGPQWQYSGETVGNEAPDPYHGAVPGIDHAPIPPTTPGTTHPPMSRCCTPGVPVSGVPWFARLLLDTITGSKCRNQSKKPSPLETPLVTPLVYHCFLPNISDISDRVLVGISTFLTFQSKTVKIMKKCHFQSKTVKIMKKCHFPEPPSLKHGSFLTKLNGFLLFFTVFHCFHCFEGLRFPNGILRNV